MECCFNQHSLTVDRKVVCHDSKSYSSYMLDLFSSPLQNGGTHCLILPRHQGFLVTPNSPLLQCHPQSPVPGSLVPQTEMEVRARSMTRSHFFFPAVYSWGLLKAQLPKLSQFFQEQTPTNGEDKFYYWTLCRPGPKTFLRTTAFGLGELLTSLVCLPSIPS